MVSLKYLEEAMGFCRYFPLSVSKEPSARNRIFELQNFDDR